MPRRQIPPSEFHFSFVRSSGPGGQNVNKTSSKVQLRWPISRSTVFTTEEKELLKTRLPVNEAGEVVLSCDVTRSQIQNRQKVIRRLSDLVARALTPRKKRVATRPTRAAKVRRLEQKRRHAEKKLKRRIIF